MDPTSTPRGPRMNNRAGDFAASYLGASVQNLEENQVSLQEDVSTLKELFHGLSSTVGQMNNIGWPVRTGPSQGMDSIIASLQSAKQFSMDLDRLKGTFGPVNGDFDNTAKELTADVRAKKFESGTKNEYAFDIH